MKFLRLYFDNLKVSLCCFLFIVALLGVLFLLPFGIILLFGTSEQMVVGIALLLFVLFIFPLIKTLMDW